MVDYIGGVLSICPPYFSGC